jgi:hypothetical protein
MVMRTIMAVTGSPGAIRGIKKIKDIPSQTVSIIIKKRRIMYCQVKPPINECPFR